jgi:tryptophan synthase alpha chain
LTDRIAAAFAGHTRRAALMPYVMGGFPDLERSRAVAAACADAGADVVELGVPFSDPLADGPVIHAAATTALAGGTTLADVLDLCDGLAPRVPVVLMVYANLALACGAEAFAARAARSGAAGLIVPDLPHDEAAAMRAACDTAGVALVPLVAPNTSAKRLDAIGRDARGFVYAVSLAGTTGEQPGLPADLAQLVERVRRGAGSTPVAVGFGIATPEQARSVAEAADAPAVHELVGSLARALE